MADLVKMQFAFGENLLNSNIFLEFLWNRTRICTICLNPDYPRLINEAIKIFNFNM